MLEDEILRVNRPRIASIERHHDEHVTVGDVATITVDSGLVTFLELAYRSQALGRGFAPAHFVAAGAAVSAATVIVDPPSAPGMNATAGVVLDLRWEREPVAGDTFSAQATLRRFIGKTTAQFDVEVRGLSRDLIADGSYILVRPSGPIERHLHKGSTEAGNRAAPVVAAAPPDVVFAGEGAAPVCALSLSPQHERPRVVEPGDEELELFRFQWPVLRQRTEREAIWDYRTDLFRLLMNPVGGAAHPLGRRTHPLGCLLLSLSIDVAKEFTGGAAIRRSSIRCTKPIDLSSQLVVRLRQTDDELMISTEQHDQSIAWVSVVLQ